MCNIPIAQTIVRPHPTLYARCYASRKMLNKDCTVGMTAGRKYDHSWASQRAVRMAARSDCLHLAELIDCVGLYNRLVLS